MEMLSYAFMQRALLVGILLAVIIPSIGTIVVVRRLSMMGDALSHVALAGVTLGLIAGVNPVVSSMVLCIVGAFGIEFFRKKIPVYSEVAIAVILSIGVGLAGVLSGYVDNAANLNSFLFGSIVAITDFELYLVIGVSAVVLMLFFLFYKELFYLAFDEKMARLAGVPVSLINTCFTMLTAVTVSIAARTVGVLIVSSLMVIPVICAMQVAKSYRQTILYAIGFALVSTVAGLSISFYFGPKPGGTIVLLAAALLVLIYAVKSIFMRRLNKF